MSLLLPLTERQKQKARAQGVRMARATAQRRQSMLANAERVAAEMGAQRPRTVAGWVALAMTKRRDAAARALGVSYAALNSRLYRSSEMDERLAERVLERLSIEFPATPWWRKE